jgi:hypothetical protein
MLKLALCVGINDYPGTGSDLAGCVNDANDWAAELAIRGFEVKKILNKDATRANIREAIQEMLAKCKSGDSALVQYSGHGSFVPDIDGDEPDGSDECLCPYDISSKGVITDDELFVLYNARPRNVKLVMISDSCHSGTIAKFAPIITPPTATGPKPPQRKVRFLPPGAFLSKGKLSKLGIRAGLRRASPPGRNAALSLSGCQDSEYSYDAYFEGRPNGAFTFVALKALNKLPASATYKQWLVAIKKTLPSQQYPQSPNLFGSSTMKKWKVLA